MISFRRAPLKLKTLLICLALPWLTNCGATPSSSNASSPTNYTCQALTGTTLTATAANQTPIHVGCQYSNEPCVTIRICEPGTSNCQTINDVLLDTGSYGLRLFSCTHTLNLPSVTAGSGSLAEVTGFADGSCDWGPVKYADVIIGSGSEKASNVPIHIIDHSYASVPSSGQIGFTCSSFDYSPTQAGFNGILGVGLATQDCGTYCSSAGNSGGGSYFSCSGTTCTGHSTSVQVTNPVALMPTNNNGVILDFTQSYTPSTFPLAGLTTLSGTLTLGIGTSTGNNSATATHVFQTDASANFNTTYPTTASSALSTSFIDSGSNTYAFPDVGSTIGTCGSNTIAPGFYCPSSTKTLTATQASASGKNGTSQTVTFYIANSVSLFTNANNVFNDVGAALPSISTSNYFDWGFPFFIGRKVFSSVGTATAPTYGAGPYWAW